MATVFIWNNNQVFARRSYPGHASMSIDDNWSAMQLASYVSFWPSNGSNKFSTEATSPNPTLKADVAMETYAPDHVIRLTGLDVNKMLASWRNTRTEFSTYQFLRRNCSTAVARVLKAGSAAGGTMKRHNSVWTPLKVKRLALAMGGTKMTWSALLQEFASAGQLSSESATAMEGYGKRDARHGVNSATDVAVHGGGKRLMTQAAMVWTPPAPPQQPSLFNIRASTGSIIGPPGFNDCIQDFEPDEAEEDDDILVL